MGDVSITFGNETVGVVRFIQPEPGLSALRTASGFRVHIPASVTFSEPRGSRLPLSLENLRLTLFTDNAGKLFEIVTGQCDSILTTPMSDTPIQFSCDWTDRAFACYEGIRAGREPKFRLQVCGDIRNILVEGNSRTGREGCSAATRFYQRGETGYSREVWTKMMRDVGVGDSVLVEIPLPSDPPSGWDPVWAALRDARDSFDTGGSTGWKNTVTSVRLALEEWRNLKGEKEDPGAGWQVPERSDLQSRTKLQRIDAIRWHLIQLAHYGAHTKADEWTRDDAMLMLSTLASLLAVRKP